MKKYILNFSIVMAVVLLAIASIYAIYYAYFRASLINERESLYTYSLNNASEKLEKDVEDVFFALADFNGEKTFEEFDGYGTLDGGALQVVIGGENFKRELSENQYRNIFGRYEGVNEQIVTALPESLFGDSYILFAEKAGERKYQFILQSQSKLLGGIFLHGDENLLIVSFDGIILAGMQEVSGGNIFDIIDTVKYESLADFGSAYMPLSGSNHFVIKNAVGSFGIEVVGYVSGAAIDSAVGEQMRMNAFFTVGVAAVSFVGAAFILIIYLSLNNKNLAGRFVRGKYSLIIDKFGNIIMRNKNFSKQFNYKSIIDNTLEKNTEITDLLSSNGDITLKLLDKSENERYIRFMTARSIIGYRMIGSEVTELVTDFLECKELVNSDPLTKLPSGDQIAEDFEAARAVKGESQEFCILLLEIKDMEKYRSMFGHEVCDTLRLQFADRLKNMFEGRIYHKGDTRFLVFSQSDSSTEYITKHSDKLEAALSAPVKINGHYYKILYKAGYSKPFTAGGKSGIEKYVKQAVYALHSAMTLGERNTVGFFDALLKGDSVVYEDRNAIINLIDSGQIEIYYQPQYSIEGNEIIGFEALTRVKKRLNIPISEFIHLAERNGSIIELGEYAYKAAMAFAQEIKHLNITISLNVSPVQLMQEGFIEKLIQHYRTQKLKKHSIAVEITETYLMTNYNHMIKNLELLHKEGIDVHLDDFGIIYSSMLYLKRLPIDAIKIDREFIHDISVNEYSKMIVGVISAAAKHLKLDCIAEGVETKEQVNVLKSLGCNIIQGFYISQAVLPLDAKKMAVKYSKKEKD